MTQAKIGLAGFGPLGMQLADALAGHPYLCLVSVFEQEPLRAATLKELEIPFCAEAIEDWAKTCDLVIATEASISVASTPVLFGPTLVDECPRLFHAGTHDWSKAWRIPCADAIALRRLLELVGPAQRIFSSCARRTGAATDHRFARVDALEPLLDVSHEDQDLQDYLKPLVESVTMRRTRVPYTHSHVHHLKITLCDNYEYSNLERALDSSSRIRVAAGFANTGQLQEFDRDLGRSRGDRPEIFVWQETIAMFGGCLFLTVDVDSNATIIPETLDLLCHFAAPKLSVTEVRLITDETLGLGALT
jgi:glyceraldehyde-3-phosphate dehydrogenase/erythrose-4-phosphate dehydrogenase